MVRRIDLPGDGSSTPSRWETQLDAAVISLATDDAGRWIAVVLNDRSLALLDADSGQQHLRLAAPATVTGLEFSVTGTAWPSRAQKARSMYAAQRMAALSSGSKRARRARCMEPDSWRMGPFSP